MLLSLDRIRTVLCLGAHPDDIEIGCGGTVLSLIAGQPQLHVYWIVFSGDPRRRAEARASCEAFCQGAARVQLVQQKFHDSFFPDEGRQLKHFVQGLAGSLRPDVIFTHARHDRHQDHRLLAELTWNAFRNHLILEYEIPKWEGDLEPPNVYVPLSQDLVERKIALLLQHFPSQHDKPWFDRETFAALLRLRGLEAKAPSRYAEAFHGRKLQLWPPCRERLPAGQG